MEIANVDAAKSQLSDLIERAMNGEEVVIADAGRPLVRLVPIPSPSPSGPRVGGQCRGQIRIADDFDDLPPGFAEAFGIETE